MFNLYFIPYITFHFVDIQNKILAKLYLPQIEMLGSKTEAHPL